MSTRLFIFVFFIHLSLTFAANDLFTSVDNERANHCKCENHNCGCCIHIESHLATINGTLCSNFTYLPNDIGISLTITYNNQTFYNRTVSVRNPPPICPIIIEEINVEACLRFYDIELNEKHFSGCAQISIKLFREIPILKANLGCWNISKPDRLIDSINPPVKNLNYSDEIIYLSNEIPVSDI